MQTRSSLTPLVTLTSLLSLAACMSSNEAAHDDVPEEATALRAEALTPSASPGNSSADEAATPDTPVARVCRSLMRRERDCSVLFLSALVAERVRLDIPAGIAARDRAIGRDALISEALNEYTDDSKDERIATACADVAEKLPADRGERLVSAGETCLGHETCGPFVACAVPISIQP